MNPYEAPQTIDRAEPVTQAIPRERPSFVSRNLIIVVIVVIQLTRAVVKFFSQ